MQAHKLSIVLPSTFGESTPADNATLQSAYDVAIKRFNHDFGGCTLIDGQGCWTNSDGQVIAESVKILFALTDAPLGELHFVGKDVAQYVKATLQQSCVAYWVDYVATFELV